MALGRPREGEGGGMGAGALRGRSKAAGDGPIKTGQHTLTIFLEHCDLFLEHRIAQYVQTIVLSRHSVCSSVEKN